jgi:hypothetical protein
MSNPTKIRLNHEQFYLLCKWTESKGDELYDVKYDQRAADATAELGFPVTEAKAKEAAVLTGYEHHVGRVNLIYYALAALAASGGITLTNLARKGREIVREARKKSEGDGTMELFPEAPEESAPFVPDIDDEATAAFAGEEVLLEESEEDNNEIPL